MTYPYQQVLAYLTYVAEATSPCRDEHERMINFNARHLHSLYVTPTQDKAGNWVDKEVTVGESFAYNYPFLADKLPATVLGFVDYLRQR